MIMEAVDGSNNNNNNNNATNFGCNMYSLRCVTAGRDLWECLRFAQEYLP